MPKIGKPETEEEVLKRIYGADRVLTPEEEREYLGKPKKGRPKKDSNIMKGRADLKNNQSTIDCEFNVKKGLSPTVKKALKKAVNQELDKKLSGSGLKKSHSRISLSSSDSDSEGGDLIHIDIGSHNSRKGMKGKGIPDDKKSKALDMALYFGSKPGFQNAFLSALTPSEKNQEFLTNYAINKLSSGGKIKGKGSILGNIGMAYGNAWNQKAVKGSPEDNALKFFHNEFIPRAMKPIDVLAPPVGEVGHEVFNGLKEHQGYGIKRGRGRPRKDTGLGYHPKN